MSQNTRKSSPPESALLQFTQIKSWYIPSDTETYTRLRDLKIPLLKIHKDFIPTLQLATSHAGLRAKSRKFSEVLEPALDKLGLAWQSRAGRKCRLGDTRLVFSAIEDQRNRQAVNKMDETLKRFFARWAHGYAPVYSTSGGKLKLVVDYWFDKERDPVIPVQDVTPPPHHEIVLGFTKIRLTFHRQKQMVQTQVYTQTGTEWREIHTSTCLPSQLSDVHPFLAAQAELVNRYIAANP